MIREYSIPFGELSVTRQEVYKAMGYGTQTPDGDIRKMVDEAIGHATTFGIARFMYLTVEGYLTKNTLQIADQTLCVGTTIARQLAGSETFMLFVATTGREFEEWLEKVKSSNDIVLQFIADSLGSCLAEKTADCMEAYIKQEISPKNLKHTNRLSPGYCDWPVSEQQKLFSLFPTPNPCDIQLLPSCLMIPVKSVSGIIGIGTNVGRSDYPCGLCTLERCFKNKSRSK